MTMGSQIFLRLFAYEIFRGSTRTCFHVCCEIKLVNQSHKPTHELLILGPQRGRAQKSRLAHYSARVRADTDRTTQQWPSLSVLARGQSRRQFCLDSNQFCSICFS